MEKSMKIQMDIKNNAQDLQNYVLDLKNWEEEMKKKEVELAGSKVERMNFPPPRNKAKRNKVESVKSSVKNKTKKISGYDYSAWDKYDVEKACAELDDSDNDEKSEIKKQDKIEELAKSVCPDEMGDGTGSEEENDEDDESKLSLIDQACYEKELGNKFVRNEQWDDAIKCYTKAINLDGKNPIYYANRSLCFLKLKNFRSAEVDATIAIQLDKSYVKAYQRRGYARLGLGQLTEAKGDFEEVLKIEPKNSLMAFEVSKINDKINKELSKIQPKATFNPKNMFKTETKKQEKNEASHLKLQSKCDTSEKKTHNASLSKSEILPKEIKVGEKPADSLHHIKEKERKKMNGRDKNEENEEIEGRIKEEALPSVFEELPDYCRIIQPIEVPPHKRSKEPLKKIPIRFIRNDKELTEVGGGDADSNSNTSKSTFATPFVVNKTKYEEEMRFSLDMPKTSVQFQNNWKAIKKHPKEAYMYLEKVSDSLPQIFENSLESDLFSDLLRFLADDCPEKNLPTVYSFLLNLSNVKRFCSMTLFMSKEDRANLRKCLDDLKGIKSDGEISNLLSTYEL